MVLSLVRLTNLASLWRRPSDVPPRAGCWLLDYIWMLVPEAELQTRLLNAEGVSRAAPRGMQC